MSTQAKALPDNLDALAQREDFKKVNADETIKTLKVKLDDAGVAYTSTDDKAELVWRWMYYQGVDFSTEEANTDTEAKGAPEATNIEPVSEEDSQQFENVTDNDKAVSEAKEGDVESNSEIQNTPTDQETNNTAPLPLDDEAEKHRKAAILRRQEQAASFQNQSRIDRVAITASIDKQISVTNIGQYSVFEPASRTMIESGKTVTIKPTATVSIARINSNIQQINSLRGNVLKIEE